MVNENHNFVNLSERNVGGVSGGNNNLRNSPKPIFGNKSREKKTLLTSSGNTKLKKKKLK
jgi:hypothetical protein